MNPTSISVKKALIFYQYIFLFIILYMNPAPISGIIIIIT